MLRFLVLSVVLFSAGTLSAQKNLVWPVLGMTTYEENPETGALKPSFPSILSSQFEGKEVVISGYLVPVDAEAKRYALSKNPFSSCFFCGNAGPETVIGLHFEESPGRFPTDEYLPIAGRLRLNHGGSELFFTIQNARIAE